MDLKSIVKNNNNRNLKWIIGFTWLVYLAYSVVFYISRTLYMDAGYMSFNLINEEVFALEHQRLSFIYLQSIPLLLVKLNLSLKIILLGMSIWSTLLYGIIAWVLVKVFDELPLALLWIAMLVMPFKALFHFALCESFMTIGFSLLVLGYLLFLDKNKLNPKRYDFIVLLFLVLSTLFFHPSSILYLGIVGWYYFLNYGYNANFKKFLISLMAGVLLYWFLKPSSGYDETILSQLFSKSVISNLFNSYLFDYLHGNWAGFYLFFTLLFGLVCVYFIVIKKYWVAVLYSLSVFVVLLFCAIVYYKGDSAYFMEKNLAPFCMAILIPFHFILKQNYKSWITIVLVFIFGVNLIQLYKVGQEFVDRTEKIEKLVNVMVHNKIKKGVISKDIYHYTENIGIWTLPYETLMLSRLRYEQNVTVFAASNAQDKLREIGSNDVFLGADFFPPLPLEKLYFNKKYFMNLNGKYADIDGLVKAKNQ